MLLVELQTGPVLEKIFSMQADQASWAGFVQLTVQIVASHDPTLVVMPLPWEIHA